MNPVPLSALAPDIVCCCVAANANACITVCDSGCSDSAGFGLTNVAIQCKLWCKAALKLQGLICVRT
jgi:hypothetical protein